MTQGALDTVKFRIDEPLVPDDGAGLVAQGWACKSVVSGGDDGKAYVTEVYHNQKTGVRVVTNGLDVKIEGSVPRVLGLTNDQQESVTEGDAMQAFYDMTWNLIPRTCEKEPPGLTRVDLARNFTGSVPRVVNRYAALKHPSIRSTPRVFFGESVSFFGDQRELVIYDKGAEMGGEAGKLGRVECRWKGAKGVAQLVAPWDVRLSQAPIKGPCLPFYLSMETQIHKGYRRWSEHTRSHGGKPGRRQVLDGSASSYRVVVPGKAKVYYVPFTNDLLNNSMQADVAALGRLKPVPVLRSMQELLFHLVCQGGEAAELWRDTLGGMKRTTAYRWERARRTYEGSHVDLSPVDLLSLVWAQDAA